MALNFGKRHLSYTPISLMRTDPEAQLYRSNISTKALFRSIKILSVTDIHNEIKMIDVQYNWFCHPNSPNKHTELVKFKHLRLLPCNPKPKKSNGLYIDNNLLYLFPGSPVYLILRPIIRFAGSSVRHRYLPTCNQWIATLGRRSGCIWNQTSIGHCL